MDDNSGGLKGGGSVGGRPPPPIGSFLKPLFLCKSIYFVVRICDKMKTELINCLPTPFFKIFGSATG